MLLPSLRIKIKLIKQFVKALNRESDCFAYLCEKFPVGLLSTEKLRTDIFDVPPDTTLNAPKTDKYFPLTVTTLKEILGVIFTALTKNFLGNSKASNYHDLLKQLLNFY